MNDSKLIGSFGLFTKLIICLFMMLWIAVCIKKSREINRVNRYSIVIYDLNGQITVIDGLRLNFKNNDVAWSFMKEHKTMYPFYYFGHVSIGKNSDLPIMIKYL